MRDINIMNGGQIMDQSKKSVPMGHNCYQSVVSSSYWIIALYCEVVAETIKRYNNG